MCISKIDGKSRVQNYFLPVFFFQYFNFSDVYVYDKRNHIFCECVVHSHLVALFSLCQITNLDRSGYLYPKASLCPQQVQSLHSPPHSDQISTEFSLSSPTLQKEFIRETPWSLVTRSGNTLSLVDEDQGDSPHFTEKQPQSRAGRCLNQGLDIPGLPLQL